jgi:hypothetical protein
MIQNIWGKLNNLNDQGILDALVWLGGRVYYASPQGNDNNNGSIDAPVLTLEKAYSFLRSGKNDAIVIMQDWIDGLTDAAGSCTIRLDAAFSWNKPATHLIGMQPSFADVLISPRARLAPTSTTTAFKNFFTIPAGVSGCLFRGIQWFHDFGTDTTDQIAVTIVSSRNVFHRCHIVGNANESDAGGRSLLITTGTGNKGENLFEDCTIGADTFSRSAASALLGFAGSQSTRNWFRNCRFLSAASAASPLIIAAGAGAIDRFVYLENCKFINFGTALTKLSSINASQNGKFIYENPVLVGIPIFGDTANTIVMGTAPSAGAGIAVAPTA